MAQFQAYKTFNFIISVLFVELIYSVDRSKFEVIDKMLCRKIHQKKPDLKALHEGNEINNIKLIMRPQVKKITSESNKYRRSKRGGKLELAKVLAKSKLVRREISPKALLTSGMKCQTAGDIANMPTLPTRRNCLQ